MPNRRRRSKAAGAAATAESSSDENEEVHSKDGRKEEAPTRTKNVDKSATTATLEEVEFLNHKAMPSPPKRNRASKSATAPKPAPKPAPALQSDARESEATTERVREMDRKLNERAAQEAQAAELQRLAAENQKLKRKLNLDKQSAESTSPNQPRKRENNSQRRVQVVNAVCVIQLASK